MPPRHIVMLGPFALAPKATMSARALPLAEALVARGYRVTLILPPWDNPEQSGRRWCERGVTIEHISLPQRLGAAGIAVRLRAATVAAQPDLVHVFKPKGHGALAALSLGQRYPLVVDSDDWEGRGGWNDVNRYSAAQRALFAWQERDLPRRALANTVASRTLETRLWGFGIPPTRVSYLPNGLSRWRYAGWPAPAREVAALRADLGLAGGPVLLLYTRFVEFAPARAVAILRDVLAQCPTMRLLVIGKGFFGEEAKLLREAHAAGVADAIVQLPWVERERLAAHLALGDVAFLPYSDTPINRAKCSVKLLDLMAAARPVVADAVGQLHDYLGGDSGAGPSGVLIPPESPEQFAPALVALLRDPARRRQLGEAACARAWRDFDWARLAERAEAAYVAAWQRAAGDTR